MNRYHSFSELSIRGTLMGTLAAGLLFVSAGTEAFSQPKPASIPDAQIEANVLKALAGAPELAGQAITTTTVYGTVTLSGTVQDEPSRDTAEHLAANAEGVQKVVDQLSISSPAISDPGQSDSQDPTAASTNPNLQSDGTMAPQTAEPQTASPQNPPDTSNVPQNGQAPPASQSSTSQHPQSGQYPRRPQPYGRPYAPGPNSYPEQPSVSQKGGDLVAVPTGAILRVRVNQGMDSKHTLPGTVFDGVVLNDIVAGGSIAIPRGASVRGAVVEVHKAGEFKGKGELKLQLTQIDLGGKTYPVATDLWFNQGADKTGNTVSNTIGLGAVGALIGAVAGGGPGAAIGAGVGGVAGLGVSSATGRGEAVLPSEAIVTFHLTQPTQLTTVSQLELNRLGSGVPVGAQPPQMHRRYGYPPPPYYGPYYGPGYPPPPYFGPAY